MLTPNEVVAVEMAGDMRKLKERQSKSVGLGDRLSLGAREGGTSITPKLLALEHRDLLLYLSLNHYTLFIVR